MDKDTFGIRNFYKAPPGKILFFIDFSGFELRLMAWKSGDQVMIEVFRDPKGDLHRRTAATMTGKPEAEVTKAERQGAKPANFGICYGGTEYALQETYLKEDGIRKTLEECAAAIRAIKVTYPGIPAFQRAAAIQAREDGYSETIYGYIRLLENINSPHKGLRNSDERRAMNTPIQGSAAEIMKRCQNAAYDMAALEGWHGHADQIGQIHDEIIFQMDDDPVLVKRVGDWIKAVMEQPPIPGFPVPIIAEASVGYEWGRKIPLNKWLEERGVA
jgi:DNA polymerase-1